MLLVYVLGVAASHVAFAVARARGRAIASALDVLGAALSRSFFLIPTLPMLGIYLWLDRRPDDYPLRFGDWSVPTRLFSSAGREAPWSRQLARFAFYVR